MTGRQGSTKYNAGFGVIVCQKPVRRDSKKLNKTIPDILLCIRGFIEMRRIYNAFRASSALDVEKRKGE